MKRQKSFIDEKPTLYLVATPIGNLAELTPRAVDILKQVDVIAAEDTRNTRKLLSHFDIHTKLIAHHQYNENESAEGLLRLLADGNDVALVSDAGYPLISDPGQYVSRMVIDAGYSVVPISGANAMLNALVASGLPTQPFLFYGFLKPKDTLQKQELEKLKDYPQTLIFYEAPHRIKKTLQNMRQVLGDRQICLARELTKRYEEFIRGTISELLDIIDTCKGEMVIVVKGAEENTAPDSDPNELYHKINEYMQNGFSSNEAIKKVAKESGCSKNELYRKFHEQQSMR